MGMFNPSFLGSVSFVRMRVAFEASEPLVLPEYKGSAFRGCFGETLHRETCKHKGWQCENCAKRFDCPSSFLFNSYVKETHDHVGKYPKSPHPYIIDPMAGNQVKFMPGEQFGFDMTLIGTAIPLFRLIAQVFEGMGETGIGYGRKKFKPVSLLVLREDMNYAPLPYFGPPETLSISKLFVQLFKECVTLNLVHPLRIIENDTLVETAPSFALLIGRLALRIGLLAHFHCGAPWPEPELNHLIVADGISIRESSVKKTDWSRYSGTQDTTMNFDGLTGHITYSGNGLDEWMPLLTLGSFLHAGSSATFGLGKYTIKPCP